MSDLLDNIPDVSFIDNFSPETVTDMMVSSFSEKYKEITNKSITLKAADPVLMLLQAISLPVYQALQIINNAGRMNLLKYATGEYLDNLAAFKNITRQSAMPSTVEIQFTLSSEQDETIVIPAGTNVTTGNYDVFWETTEDKEILPGDLQVVATAVCTESGESSNGYAPGTITELVNTIPYIDIITNITTSEGGMDIESDERLKERVYLAPSAYSCAGSRDAYVYFVKTVNPKITDVAVKCNSEQAGIVNIVFMIGNRLPTSAEISEVEEYLLNSGIRPLTDGIRVSAPLVQNFDLDIVYYISSENKAKENEISTAVNNAIDEYIALQTGKIGLKINPSLLIQKVMNAGASRIVINSPDVINVSETGIAVLNDKNIVYGGLE